MNHLSIQSTYTDIEIALFNNQKIIETRKESKIHASKYFIPLLNDLLRQYTISIKELTFLSVNEGPGPFTTLRVVIASVNGLSFASHIPLIGVNALDACLQEFHNSRYPTVVLFNAFSNDVYFAIQKNNKEIHQGYKKITELIADINTMIPNEPIRFLGNGALLHKQLIVESLGTRAYFPDPLPEYCSIKQIGLMGLAMWEKQEHISNQIFPLYLKSVQ